MSENIAVIRVRGSVNTRSTVEDTLKMLRLYRRNYCVVLSSEMMGMIKKVKDFVTYGEINDDTLKLLIEKRGEVFKGRNDKKALKHENKKFKPYFRLHPPKGGFERKGVKVGFASGGALGYRNKKIND